MEADQTALPHRRAKIVPAPRRKDIFLKKGKGIQLVEVEQAFKIWELGLKYVVILLNWMCTSYMFAISLLGFALDDKNFNKVPFAACHSV